MDVASKSQVGSAETAQHIRLKYRPDIDGLRAIAVASVVVYHLRIPFGSRFLLHGGFLGVDLFFVLSGFLITGILAAEIRSRGKLNFANFYLRRARRILPPLLLVLAACAPFSYLLLLPEEMKTFAASMWAALAFYSNFFWYFQLQQYGAPNGLLQPLLHTWSLAIEEQYYLLFPAVLLCTMRFCRRPVFVLAAAAVVGFIVAQATTWLAEPFSFFSPASRAWELLTGSALGLARMQLREAGAGRTRSSYLPAAGLALILGSVAFGELGDRLHPGLATVPTILGTCLVIAFADRRDWVTRLLSSPPFVWVGKLSYSIYLWHFPIFAFGRMLHPHLGVWDRAFGVALTLACSYLGYRIVEVPMRHRLALRPFLLVTSGALVAAALTPLMLRSLDMRFAPRSVALAKIYGGPDFDNDRLTEETWQQLAEIEGGSAPPGVRARTPLEPELHRLWFDRAASLRVLVVGNSHAKDLFNALYLNRGRFPGTEFARFGMDGAFPGQQVAQLFRSPNYRAANLVVFAPRWTKLDPVVPLIRRIRADGKIVVIADNTAEFESPGIPPLYDYFTLLDGRKPAKAVIDRKAFELRERDKLRLNKRLAALAQREGVTLYSRYSLVCDDGLRRCTQMTPDGRKALFDYGHWTVAGARYFGEVAAEQGWFSDRSLKRPR